MFLCAVNFAARWRGVAALTMLCLPAAAQQSIRFSNPTNQDAAASVNSFLPEANRKSPGAFNAPTSLFGNGPAADFDVLPGAPERVLPNPNAAQWQRVLENRKNWSLMTPEQILGVPTPESILGITDPRENPKLSPEERYLRRQERESQREATNTLERVDGWPWQRDEAITGFQTQDGNSRFGNAPDGSRRDAATPNLNRNLDPLFNQSPKTTASMNPRMDSIWASPFDSSEPLPKPTPEQLAGMERVRALLQSPAAPERTPTPAGFSPQPAAAPDPFLQSLPAFNPAGHSFSTVGKDISKPIGLMPLAGVTGPLPAPAKKAPLVQPPPWMSAQSPQSPTLPQRQF